MVLIKPKANGILGVRQDDEKKYRKHFSSLDRLFSFRWLRIRRSTFRARILLIFGVILLSLSFSVFYKCEIQGQCNIGPDRRSSSGVILAAHQKPFVVELPANVNYSDPLNKKLPKGLMRVLRSPFLQEIIPVVQFYQRPGLLPCKRNHYIYRNLKQARSLNPVVYFIGPEECASMAKELDIILEPYISYQDVIAWFSATIGKPIGYQVRWFVLRVFMERHSIPRIFYTDSDVALFTNISEIVPAILPRTYLALAIRWPSLRPPLGPSQYPSTAVSGHVSLWTYEAIVDFNNFFALFFKNAVLFGTPGDLSLVEEKAYNDMVPLGWYTFNYCWAQPDLHPLCVSDRDSGVTPERAGRLRGLFLPKFRPESLCQPRWCNATQNTPEGWCTFDNNFSVQTPRQFFRYRPKEGMKCPTSMHYTYFEDWSPERLQQTSPVHFLGVHFQAHKKGFISRGDDPALTWGSSED